MGLLGFVLRRRRGGGAKTTPCLKLVRIVLETWYLVCKYTHICSFRKYLVAFSFLLFKSYIAPVREMRFEQFYLNLTLGSHLRVLGRRAHLRVLRRTFPVYHYTRRIYSLLLKLQKQPLELFYKKRVFLRPATLLKRRLCHRYFPINFWKFLRTHFLQSTSVWLLAKLLKKSIVFWLYTTAQCCLWFCVQLILQWEATQLWRSHEYYIKFGNLFTKKFWLMTFTTYVFN